MDWPGSQGASGSGRPGGAGWAPFSRIDWGGKPGERRPGGMNGEAGERRVPRQAAGWRATSLGFDTRWMI